MEVSAPSKIWQTDITYISIGEKFYYAVFIIDVYTKKIVGYQVSNHMRATANMEAMAMALKENKPPLIHHSDRGSQYIYKDYIALLKANNCKISMSLSAQDNAYAERINKTIKEEYLDYWKPKTFEELKRHMKNAVNQYNNGRPHNNIGKLSPVDFENKWLNNQLNSKPIFTNFENEKLIKIYALQAHFPYPHLDVSLTFDTISPLQVHFPGSHFVHSLADMSVLQVHFPTSHLHSPLATHLHPSTCAVSLDISFKSILQTGQDPATS